MKLKYKNISVPPKATGKTSIIERYSILQVELRSQAYSLYFIEEPIDRLAFLQVMAHHSYTLGISSEAQTN